MRIEKAQSKRWLAPITFFGCLIAVQGGIDAQPIGTTLTTLEARFAMADRVFTGHISEVRRRVLNRPKIRNGKPDWGSGSRVEYTLSVKVDETLKGAEGEKVVTLQTIVGNRVDERYQQWAEAKTMGLWFVGTSLFLGNQNWEFLPLGDLVDAEKAHPTARHAPPMLANDLSIMDSGEAILERARKLDPKVGISRHGIGPRILEFRIPHSIGNRIRRSDYHRLLLVVEPSIESTARRMIETPETFLDEPTGPQTPINKYYLRLAGVELLRYFGSMENGELLESQMNAALQRFELNGFHQVRKKAFESLLHMNPQQALPDFSNEITELDLTDAKISPKLLKTIAQLKSLSLISLGNHQLNDKTIHLLRQHELLHATSLATTHDDSSRPMSPADVGGICLFGCDISDRGLNELAGFPNLQFLDLRKTNLSDSGLDQLFRFKKLSWIYLDDTAITEAGLKKLEKIPSLERIFLGNLRVSPSVIKSLEKALPDCTIIASPGSRPK